MEQLAEKENKKGDKKTIDFFATHYGKEIKLLVFRIIDELMLKESQNM